MREAESAILDDPAMHLSAPGCGQYRTFMPTADEDGLDEQLLKRSEQPVLAAWEGLMSSMQSEVSDLRNHGRWRAGKRTLMHALGIHYRELPLTAGLAWLLEPDGWHGLGSRVLSSLLGRLGLPAAVVHPVTVTTEDVRLDWRTRADLVIRMPGMTLLIEAKVYAGEGDEQCDRLFSAWHKDEVPTLVFLTRDGSPPSSAVRSHQQWRCLTWADVGVIVRDAIVAAPNCAPGAREFLATIEMLEADQPMPEDEKVGFYLRYRQEIEEWAGLHARTAVAFEHAFLRAAENLRSISDGPYLGEGGDDRLRWYGFELAHPEIGPARAFVAFGWTRSQIFHPTRAEHDPYIGIKLDTRSQDRPSLKELFRDAVRDCHWSSSGGSWVWYDYLPLGADDTDLDAYAGQKLNDLLAAHGYVQSALTSR